MAGPVSSTMAANTPVATQHKESEHTFGVRLAKCIANAYRFIGPVLGFCGQLLHSTPPTNKVRSAHENAFRCGMPAGSTPPLQQQMLQTPEAGRQGICDQHTAAQLVMSQASPCTPLGRVASGASSSAGGPYSATLSQAKRGRGRARMKGRAAKTLER